MEIIQPYITGIVQALVGLLATAVVALLISLRQKVSNWIKSKTTVNQREMLHKFSLEAFAFAETAFKDAGGNEKLTAAYGYLSRRAKEHGIEISALEIEVIIEKSVLEFNGKPSAKGDVPR